VRFFCDKQINMEHNYTSNEGAKGGLDLILTMTKEVKRKL
jgi:hypothetical protein